MHEAVGSKDNVNPRFLNGCKLGGRTVLMHFAFAASKSLEGGLMSMRSTSFVDAVSQHFAPMIRGSDSLVISVVPTR
jgi:hypothetical protein